MKQPRETQGPTAGTMAGGGGGVTPLKKRLRKLPAPHGSLALPAHGSLHEDAGAAVALASVALPQTAGVSDVSGKRRRLTALALGRLLVGWNRI